jgi:acetyl-CoA carboxylase carboxyltransferase component
MTDPLMTQTRRALPTLLEHIDAIVDPSTYRAINDEGGHAEVEGRPVTIGRTGSLFDWAIARRQPYIAVASGRGAPLRGGPRNMGTLDPVHGMSAGPMFPPMLTRRRDSPVVSAVVHHSFGDSSFFTGLSDYVIQLEGTCMALTGPRVLAIGTTEKVTMEELGGAHVHRRNGQVDAVATSLDEVYSLIRQALSYLPTAGGKALPLVAASAPRAKLGAGPFAIADVLDAVFDAGSIFEIKPDYSPSVITGFARMNGIPVGVVASNRAVDDGVIGSEACVKIARHIATCDAFGLPLIFLLDTPGSPVDEPANREPRVARLMTLAQAVTQSAVPKCFVVLGQAFGAGLIVTGPARKSTDLVVAWPDAAIGYPNRELGSPHIEAEFALPDGTIAPGETREVIASHLRGVLGPDPLSQPGPLGRWPVCL